MSYDLEVRHDPEYSKRASLSEIRSVIESTFSLQRIDPHFYVHEEGDVRVEIDFTAPEGSLDARGETSNEIVAVELGVPYPYLDASRGALFQIAFLVAHHLGWKVYDPQSDRDVDEEDENTAPASPGRQVAVSSIKLPFAVAALALGAIIAAYVVFWLDVYWGSHEDTFFVLSPVLGLLLIYVAARLFPGATSRRSSRRGGIP